MKKKTGRILFVARFYGEADEFYDIDYISADSRSSFNEKLQDRFIRYNSKDLVPVLFSKNIDYETEGPFCGRASCEFYHFLLYPVKKH